MFEFVFHNPTKIVFGRGREGLIGSEIREAGCRRVLFVHGQQSVKRSGLYERTLASLQEAGVEAVPFGGVVPNPVLSHTRQGVALAKIQQADGVLAVGGGSVLDEAKAIAAGACSDRDVWDFFLGEPITAALPVFTILTLAATGSEMNRNSVVTNEESRQKYAISSPHLAPRVSILNPELTCTVPLDHSTYGAVDAIAHVIEAYFTGRIRARLQDRLVEAIVRTVMDSHNQILEHPTSYEARAELMWAATLALNGLTTAGVGGYGMPNHMIEHSLSAFYNIPHGAGLAIVIPAWMKWLAPRQPAPFERFAREIFGKTRAADAISGLETWFRAIKAPTRLGEVHIPAADIPALAENAHGLARQWGLADVYTPATIGQILELAA
ncbi:MAG: iron-containing alcohol dehydrogenase [Thermodesulfobacteriota bacterium]